MKTRFTQFVPIAALLSLSAPLPAGAGVTVISSVPYTVTASGEYEVKNDLTANGTDGIDVNASDVVINLNGHMLTQSQTGTGAGVHALYPSFNVTVRGGQISGFSEGVRMDYIEGVVENMKLINNVHGVLLLEYVVVSGCNIFGTATPDSYGVLITGGHTEVAHCQISNCNTGVFTFIGGSGIIGNYIDGCTVGLSLSVGDKYQGNVTTNCPTPFSGGTPVGQENG